MDEWDKIILQNKDEEKSVIDIADTYKANVGKQDDVVAGKNVIPAANAGAAPVSPVTPASMSRPAAKEEAKSPARPVVSPYTPTVTALSRRESRLPMITEFTGKLSTFALALSIAFVFYSYAVHISNLGLKLTIAGTADSVAGKTERIRDTLASLSGAAGGRTNSQLAAPAASYKKEVPAASVPEVTTTTVSDFKATTTFW